MKTEDFSGVVPVPPTEKSRRRTVNQVTVNRKILKGETETIEGEKDTRRNDTSERSERRKTSYKCVTKETNPDTARNPVEKVFITKLIMNARSLRCRVSTRDLDHGRRRPVDVTLESVRRE